MITSATASPAGVEIRDETGTHFISFRKPNRKARKVRAIQPPKAGRIEPVALPKSRWQNHALPASFTL